MGLILCYNNCKRVVCNYRKAASLAFHPGDFVFFKDTRRKRQQSCRRLSEHLVHTTTSLRRLCCGGALRIWYNNCKRVVCNYRKAASLAFHPGDFVFFKDTRRKRQQSCRRLSEHLVHTTTSLRRLCCGGALRIWYNNCKRVVCNYRKPASLAFHPGSFVFFKTHAARGNKVAGG